MEADKYDQRWEWLANNYHKLPGSTTRNAVYILYDKYCLTAGGYHQAANKEKGDALYRAMMELGVKLEGDDPCPPPPPPPITQDGAEQYDDVMAAEALMQP